MQDFSSITPHISVSLAISPQDIVNTCHNSLAHLDDGELFIETLYTENLLWDDGRLKQSSNNRSKGFGLRGILGEATAYAHSSRLTKPALLQAAETISLLQKTTQNHHHINLDSAPSPQPHAYYGEDNPLDALHKAHKIALLEEIDGYIRQKDNRIRQVSIGLYNEWQAVAIFRPDSGWMQDIRPLSRLNISVILEQDGRMERGSAGLGGRKPLANYISSSSWHHHAHEALRQAATNLEAIAAPAGEMTVILGSGWPGVLLHEAVGHGLEGDFNRKKTSAFHHMIGKKVASSGVTVVDDATLNGCRGSLSMDDEGTLGQRSILIEDGILQGFMLDRHNARLMNTHSTGNGRRQSYAHMPMPRMTNTFMESGTDTPESIIASVKKGIYAKQFGGGQVDITSGKFVFSATEAYLVENGRITSPIKGATLIGNGPDALTRITAIGNDSALDDGIGTCGKAGQSVPVGVGQPTICIDAMTVGGTESV